MNKVLVWFFSMAMLSLFWICGTGEAQELPTQQRVSGFQGTGSQANQNQRPSQNRLNRCSAESRGQRIPKPERNRLDEGKSKKVTSSRKRKKPFKSTNRHKHKANRKAKPLLVEDKPSNKNTGTLKEQNIKSNRIDDVAYYCKNDKEDLLNHDNLSIEPDGVKKNLMV